MTLLPELEQALVQAAARRRRPHLPAGALLAVVALVLAAAAAVALGSGLVRGDGVSAGERSAGTPTLSLFAARATEADRLPRRARYSYSASEFGDPDAARHAGTFKGAQYHLVPGRKDRICIVKTADTSVGAGCISPRLLEGQWMGSIDEPPDRTIAIVAPDGYRSGRTQDRRRGSRSVTFGRNMAFATVSEAGGVVTLTADDGPAIVVEVPALPHSASAG